MRNRFSWLLIGTSLAGCADTPAHEQRWHGEVPGCGGTSTLTRIGDEVAFAAGDGALVLRGAVVADGGFFASLNTQPAGKPAFWMSVSGHLSAEAAQGHYATPRCQGDFILARVHPALL